jgi:hypothetical protein
MILQSHVLLGKCGRARLEDRPESHTALNPHVWHGPPDSGASEFAQFQQRKGMIQEKRRA